MLFFCSSSPLLSSQRKTSIEGEASRLSSASRAKSKERKSDCDSCPTLAWERTPPPRRREGRPLHTGSMEDRAPRERRLDAHNLSSERKKKEKWDSFFFPNSVGEETGTCFLQSDTSHEDLLCHSSWAGRSCGDRNHTDSSTQR